MKFPKKLKRKRVLIPLILLVALIIFRIFLPTIVKNYVNKTLANIPGYYGQVEDIDISLYRGAYVIQGLYLNKVEAETQVPFLNFPEIDISVEWKSLFKGEIVSEIYMMNPEVIYIMEDMATTTEGEATEEDWTKAITDLVPLDINHFEISNGKFAYVMLEAEPDIDLQINNFNLTANNLRNVEAAPKTLPSDITASGTSIGNGKLEIKGKVNIIKEVPDMDMEMSLTSVNATALNDFTDHYAKIDFEEGNLGIFSEVAIADGFMKGYAKVLLEDAKLIGKEDGFLETIWEGFVGVFKFLLKNQKTDKLALKAPMEGDLNNVQTGIWSTVGSIFRNAFIDAFKSGVDQDVEYKDAFQEAKEGAEERDEKEEEDDDDKKKKKKKDRKKKKDDDEEDEDDDDEEDDEKDDDEE